MGLRKPSKTGTSEPAPGSSRTIIGASAQEDTHLSVADYQAQIDDLKVENRILRDALQIQPSNHPECDIDFSSCVPAGCRSTAAGTLPASSDPSEVDGLEAAQYPTLPKQASFEALSCLFEIDRLASDSRQSLEQVLQSIVTTLPVTWPNKSVRAAGIVIGHREFLSDPFADGPPDLKRDLFILKRKAGSVFLHMKGSATISSDPPSIPESDHILLNAVAEKLSFVLDHHHRMGVHRRVESKFQKIFDTSPDAIAISRMDDGRLVDVNEGFRALTDYRREEVLGISSLALNLWEDDAYRSEIVERLRREGKILNTEIPFRRKDGTGLATLMSAVRIDLDGEPHILSIVRDVSELKRAEAELRRQKEILERQNRVLRETERELTHSRKRYYTLFHSAPVGYFTLDRSGRIQDVNRTGLELLQIGQEGIRNRGLAEFVVPEDRPLLSAHLEGVFGANTQHTCIIRLRREERQPIFLRLESIVRTDEGTGERMCQTIGSDTTKIVNTENALRFSYRFLEIANAHSRLEPTLEEFVGEIKKLTGCRAVGIRMVDAEGNIPYAFIKGFCNEFHEKESHLSIHRDQCLCIRVIRGDIDPGLPYFTPAGSFFTNSTSRLLTEANAQEIGQTRGTCNQLGYESVCLIPVRAEHQIIGLMHLADRRRNMFSDDAVTLLEKAALQLGTSIQRVNAVEALQQANVMLEVRVAERTAALQRSIKLLKEEFHRRDRMEKRLRDNKNRLQAVFDGISDPLILTDHKMTVLIINKAAKNYFQLEDRRATIGQTCREAFGHRQDFCDRCRIPEVIHSGESAVYEREGLMDPDRLEQVIVYPVIGSDLSASQAVIRISDVTESRILERQLIQNEKMASLGMLVSSIAHELNNPNSFIAFNIPILRDYFKEILPIVDRFADAHPEFEVANMPYRTFRKDAFKLFENLEHGSIRISAFLANLREFVRSSPETVKKWTDMRQIVEHALAICRTKVQKTVKRLIVSLPEGALSIHTNPVALEQILINLLVNAAQAADKEDSFIRLTVAQQEGQGGRWLLEVEDNGCGMDETKRLQIFEPFFSTKLNEGGSGLGLYVCRRLVRELGGSIQVDSRPGDGSTFSVLLPDG